MPLLLDAITPISQNLFMVITIVIVLLIIMGSFINDFKTIAKKAPKSSKKQLKQIALRKKKIKEHQKNLPKEPYDTVEYWKNPLNTDIDGFVKSYKKE